VESGGVERGRVGTGSATAGHGATAMHDRGGGAIVKEGRAAAGPSWPATRPRATEKGPGRLGRWIGFGPKEKQGIGTLLVFPKLL
jgi:hypothetical protein